jgi:hypothetical protein
VKTLSFDSSTPREYEKIELTSDTVEEIEIPEEQVVEKVEIVRRAKSFHLRRFGKE